MSATVKQGQPAKDIRLVARVTEDERRRIHAAARLEGMDASTFVKSLVLNEAARVLKIREAA